MIDENQPFLPLQDLDKLTTIPAGKTQTLYPNMFTRYKKPSLAEIRAMAPYAGFLSSRNAKLTVSTYGYLLSCYHQWLALRHMDPLTISPRELGEFIYSLSAYSRSTVLRFMHALGSFYGFLVATEQIQANPTKVFKALKYKKPEFNPRPLDHEVERRLMSSLRYEDLNDLRASCVVLLGIYEGLRREEIRVLTWTDVDRRANALVVESGKGGKRRVLPLHPVVKTALYVLYCRCRYHFGLFPSKYVFRAPRSRKKDVPTAPQLIEDLFFRAKLWNVREQDFTLHALRHTFGTRLAEKGVSPYEIRDLMGHSSISVSEAYVKTTQKQAHSAYKVAFGIDG